MTQMMKAARIHKYGEKLKLEEIPIPTPKENQLLIRVTASGVCHTDLHVVAGDMKGKPTLPFVPGHEIVGHVASLGPGVKNHKEGDIVGLPSLYWACGECEFCKSGWETLCLDQLATGFSVDGGYAEYVLAQADFAVKIPAGVDLYEMAPILCAGVTTYKGLKETGAKKGDWVAISGVGGLGHVAIQYAREFGYRVVAVDIDNEKLALAEQLGAEIVINARETDAALLVQTKLKGVRASLVTAASASAFQTAVRMLKRGGTCVMNGLPPGDFPLPICDVVLAGQVVKGSIIGTRIDMDEAIELAVKAGLHTIVEKQPLEKINDVFHRMKQGQIIGRVVLDMTR